MSATGLNYTIAFFKIQIQYGKNPILIGMPGALELDESSSRPCTVEPLRVGDFVLCTTSLRGWTTARLRALHETLLEYGESDFRGKTIICQAPE